MLTLVIVSYNSADILIRLQHALLSQPPCPVIVVDNASPDGSAGKIRATFPAVDVVTLDRNAGYGAAANAGFARATTRYVLLLNPDLECSAEAIASLLSIATTARGAEAIWAPATRQEDASTQAPAEREWVLGAAMLFDTHAMKDVGWFDENYFLFYEELDLCKRARQAGKKVMYCPEVCFPHFKGQSSGPSEKIEYLKQWHVGWSSQYYFRKFGMTSGKRRPWRMLAEYQFRALTTRSPAKRLKYRARVQGVLAFMRREAAFDVSGRPRGLKAG